MAIFSTHRRKLTLDKDRAWLFGVCSGLARTVNLDPALLRVTGIVVALFWPKLMIAGYLIAWLIMADKLTRQ